MAKRAAKKVSEPKTVASEMTGPQLASVTVDTRLAAPLRPNYGTYRTIRKQPTVALARELVAAPAIAAGWGISSRKDAEQEWVDFVRDNLLKLHDHVVRAAMLLGRIDFGWVGFEVVYVFDPQTGYIVIKKVKQLLHDITEIRVNIENGEYTGFSQRTPVGTEVVLPAEQGLLFSFNVEGSNWYGEPLLENVRDTYNKWNSADTVAADYDAKVAGVKPVVHFPPGKNKVGGVEQSNADIAKEFARQLTKPNIGISVPLIGSATTKAQLEKELQEALQWRFEMLSDDNPKQGNFSTRLNDLDKRFVRGLLTPERTALEGQFGTKADSGEHADLSLLIRAQEHKQITVSFNQQITDRLLVLNFGERARGAVWCDPMPLTDKQSAFLRELYKIALQGEVAIELIDRVDWGSVQEQLDIPLNENPVDRPESEPDPGMDPAKRKKAETELSLSEDGSGRWVTINGARVFIKDGKIEKGPSDLIGKTPSAAGQSFEQRIDNWDSNLTHNEQLALESWEESSWVLKNAQINPSEAQDWVTDQVHDLESAYAKAPKFEGDAYRGMNVSEGNAILNAKPGDVLTTDSFTSFTEDPKMAKKFATGFRNESVQSHAVVMKVTTQSGMSRGQFSRYPKQKEVILPKGARHRVLSVKSTTFGGKPGVAIELEEL